MGRLHGHNLARSKFTNRNRSRSPLGGLTISFGNRGANFDRKHSNESFGMSPISVCFNILHTLERLATNDGIL